MSRALLWLLATLLSASLAAADTDADRFARISGTDATVEDWQWTARSIADKALRSELRTALLLRDPYPRQELVALLNHEQLAVRLGALEILEEAAGDSFGLNPWASPTGEGADPANEHALALWNRWAGETGKIKAVYAGSIAEEAGIDAGDVLVAIDDVSLAEGGSPGGDEGRLCLDSGRISYADPRRETIIREALEAYVEIGQIAPTHREVPAPRYCPRRALPCIRAWLPSTAPRRWEKPPL